MNENGRQNWRWTTLSGAVVLLVLFALVAHGELWEVFGVFHMRIYFADLMAILAAGQAHVAGLDVYESNPFDPLGRPHVYGPLWLLSGHLGLTVSDAWWMGLLLALLFLVMALRVLAPRSFGASLVVVLVLLSPPLLLGLERGNNDLVIFLLLAGAGSAGASAIRWRQAEELALLVLAAVLKFYPLVALMSLWSRAGELRRIFGKAGLAVLIFGGLWWLQREGFSRGLAISPRPETVFSYGFSLLFGTWKLLVMHWELLSAGMVCGGVLVVTLLWRSWVVLWHSLPLWGVTTSWAVAGGASWLFCYLVNTNYQYRAVLLLLVLPWWLALGSETVEHAVARLGRRLCALLVAALWIAAPKYWWAEFFQETEFTATPGTPWVVFIFGIEQMLWLALSAAIAVGLTGWAWRRWRHV
ncbi:MAG: hypothetical protein Q8M02_06960 [Candidatus Didemnitutus sp.]|nr:hypothetical protein [Candidatus Didemnitutus sp.]